MATNPNELTKAQLSEIWKNDRLNRREDAEFLAKFLLARVENRRKRKLDASYVLNIDASWGRGKTFFLNNFAEQLKQQGYIVAEVNAWQDDYSDDPFLSVMSAVNDVIKPLIEKDEKKKEVWSSVKRNSAAIAIAAGKGFIRQLAKKVVGEGVEEISSLVRSDEDPNNNSTSVSEVAIAGIGSGIEAQSNQYFERMSDKLLDGFNKEKQSATNFQSNLGSLLSGENVGNLHTPMFIMIDELDRCRPPYAIAMLERIKHLFSIDNIVFVVATDTAQLRHSIKAVYGKGFDSAGYLNRFFDRSYELLAPAQSTDYFVIELIAANQIDQSIFSIPPEETLEKYFSNAFYYFGFELRDIQQFFEILSNITTIWDPKIKMELAVMIPFIVAYQRNLSLDHPELIFKELNKHPNAMKDKFSWDSKFCSNPHQLGIVKNERIGAQRVFSHFISLANESLKKTATRNSKDWIDWVNGRILEEFQIMVQSGEDLNADLMPIIRYYPNLIETAGRLGRIKSAP